MIKPSDDGSPKDFVIDLQLTVRGVGGGCPEFNPDESVISSKQINILGKPVYLIYLGDKKTDTIYYAYISDNSKGICPNVAFVEIPGLPGLFAAHMQYVNFPDNSTINQNAEQMLSDPNMATAEAIIESLKFDDK